MELPGPKPDRHLPNLPNLPLRQLWEPVGGVVLVVAGLVLAGNLIPVAAAELAITTAFARLAEIAGVLAVSMAGFTAVLGGILWASPHGHHKALGKDLVIGAVVLVVVGSVAAAGVHYLSVLAQDVIRQINATP